MHINNTMGSDGIKARIEKNLNGLEPGYTVLCLLPEGKMKETMLALLEHLLKKNHNVLLVTLNNSFDKVEEVLKKSNQDTNSFYCIDYGDRVNQEPSIEKRHIQLGNPSSLLELSIAVFDIIKEDNIKAILLDCISTMLVYNTVRTVSAFTHKLFANTKNSKVGIVILAQRGILADEISPIISSFCDKEIKL